MRHMTDIGIIALFVLAAVKAPAWIICALAALLTIPLARQTARIITSYRKLRS